MKNSHGRFFFLLFVALVSLLDATQNKYCSYKIQSSKTKDIVLYEPVSISFYTRQKTDTEMMFFDLKPLKSEDYEIIAINEKRHEYNYHDAEKSFEFLLIPKKAGTLKVRFDFSIRRASDDAVAQAYVGSRDNVKSIPTIKVHIAQAIVELQVKNLSKNVDAIGDFTLKMKLDKEKSNSYDAINVVYTLSGKGYLKETYQPLKNIQGVSLFKGKKETPPRASKEGFFYNKEWSYALVATKDFTLPSANLSLYEHQHKKYTLLQTAQKKIQIQAIDTHNLLDQQEYPEQQNYQKYLGYIYNILLFIAGFILAKILDFFPKKEINKKQCCELIQKSKTPKELLNNSLAVRIKAGLDEEINQLESMVYKHSSSKDFHKIKTNILEKLKKLN
jgi:hypothetical protein